MATLLEQARELRADRQKLIEANRTLNDAAWADGKRDFAAEEKGQYDGRFADIAKLGDRIERLEKEDGEARRIAGAADPVGGRPAPDDRRDGAATATEYRAKVDAAPGLPGIERVYQLRGTEEARGRHREAMRAYFLHPETRTAAEQRALQAATDTAGGYTYPDEQFVADLIKFVDNEVFIRRFARVHQLTSGDSIGRPSLDADPADAAWTSELGTGDEDSTMAFGKRELAPSPLAKRIKVSRTLLRRSGMGIEQLVRERLGYKFGVTQEQGFLTGTGANQPLGVFTASSSGISTSRDVSTGNTTTAFTADGLINAKYSIKGAYYPMLRWVFHRDAVKALSKLKDGDGQYLWHGSIVTGSPDTLLGVPVIISEYAPSTFTTGLYVGILGDFSKYEIAEALNMTVQRLDELYAETNQVGFIGRMEVDGMPVLEEAFARVKLA